MNQHWSASPLSEVILKSNTIDPRKEPEKKFQYVDVSSISRTKLEITETTELLGKDAPSRARRLIKKGDVLFATVRPTLKRVAIVPESLDGEVCSTGYFVFRTKPEIENSFLFYYLISDVFMGEMEKIQSGASYPAVNDTQVKQQLISYPSTEEQKRIVSILDEAFVGIDTAIANTEKNLANASELFESYLNAVFKSNVEGWVKTTLGEAYDVRDGTHDSPKYQPEGRALVTSKNLKRDGLNFEKIKYISEDDYISISRRSEVHKGDVLFAMIGTIGNPIVVEVEPDFAIKNVALFKVADDRSGHFLKYYLSSRIVIDQMMSEAKGTTQKFVGLGYLRQFPISIPELDIEAKVVKSLTDFEYEINRLESIYHQKINSLNELKQSLLQKAFSGELTAESDKLMDEAVA